MRRRTSGDAQGSVTLEAALVMPVMLIFLLVCVRMVQMRQVETLWGYAGEEAAEEARMILAARAGQEDTDDQDADQAGVRLREAVTARLLRARQTHHLEAWLTDSPQLRGLLRATGAWLETPVEGILGYRSEAVIAVGPLRYRTEYRTLLPAWAPEGVSAADETEDDEAEDGLWEADNFARGQAFRARYGGHLPSNFRVLSGFTDGRALVIKSMDLTAPSLQSESRLAQEVGRTMDAFRDFVPTAEEAAVLGGEITARAALWIVPENSPPEQLRRLRAILGTYGADGISAEVIRDGVSTRFGGTE